MKTLLLTIAILASPMLASAQGPIPQATVEAVQVIQHKNNALSFLVRAMKQFHADALVQGQPFFDVLGTGAAAEVAAYSAMQSTLIALDPTCGVPPVDPAVFAIQPDGTVIFTAPTEE